MKFSKNRINRYCGLIADAIVIWHIQKYFTRCQHFSGKDLRDEKGFETFDKPAIMITKAGYVTSQWQERGSGSAYGGEWIPKKEADERFLGEPGEIKGYIKSSGEVYETLRF